MSSASKWLTGPRNDDRSRPSKRKGGFCWSRSVSLWKSDGGRRSKGTQPCNPFASLCLFQILVLHYSRHFFSWKASSFVILTHTKWGRVGLLHVRWVEEEDRCLVSSWQVAQTWHMSFKWTGVKFSFVVTWILNPYQQLLLNELTRSGQRGVFFMENWPQVSNCWKCYLRGLFATFCYLKGPGCNYAKFLNPQNCGCQTPRRAERAIGPLRPTNSSLRFILIFPLL